jgi:hypothetical protein
LARALTILMTMVGLVPLIAMSNIVMLLIARNASRQREFSVRLALGAGRREVAGQLLKESLLVITVVGGSACGHGQWNSDDNASCREHYRAVPDAIAAKCRIQIRHSNLKSGKERRRVDRN